MRLIDLYRKFKTFKRYIVYKIRRK